METDPRMQPHPASALDVLLAERARAAEIVRELERQLGSARADLTAFDRTIEFIKGQRDGDSASAPATPRSRNQRVEADIDLAEVDVDFAGTEGELEWLIRIAETVPHLHLNTTQASKLLQRHKVVDKTLHSTRVTVQRTFDRHPELFERVRAATYRYTGIHSAGPEPGPGDTAQEMDT